MLNKVLDIAYLISVVCGSLLIAMNVKLNFYGYGLFLLSSVISTYLLSKSNANKSLMIGSVYFIVVNILGMIRA